MFSRASYRPTISNIPYVMFFIAFIDLTLDPVKAGNFSKQGKNRDRQNRLNPTNFNLNYGYGEIWFTWLYFGTF